MGEPIREAELGSVVVLLSGGMDSTVLLWWCLSEFDRVEGISINYGQRHRQELEHAHKIAEQAGIEHHAVDLCGLLGVLRGSALTDSIDVPEGHYANESMKATVVPNRNMLLISVAASAAISRELDGVAYAAHAGDHPIYPDCRPEFADAVAACLARCHYKPIRLIRPFIKMDKTEVCRFGAELGAPLENTWSCYRGGDVHCGRCGTCVERREAFSLAGVLDPTEYKA